MVAATRLKACEDITVLVVGLNNNGWCSADVGKMCRSGLTAGDSMDSLSSEPCTRVLRSSNQSLITSLITIIFLILFF